MPADQRISSPFCSGSLLALILLAARPLGPPAVASDPLVSTPDAVCPGAQAFVPQGKVAPKDAASAVQSFELRVINGQTGRPEPDIRCQHTEWVRLLNDRKAFER
jgi:hypothetical protein